MLVYMYMDSSTVCVRAPPPARQQSYCDLCSLCTSVNPVTVIQLLQFV